MALQTAGSNEAMPCWQGGGAELERWTEAWKMLRRKSEVVKDWQGGMCSDYSIPKVGEMLSLLLRGKAGLEGG